jgi:hypothetical protein
MDPTQEHGVNGAQAHGLDGARYKRSRLQVRYVQARGGQDGDHSLREGKQHRPRPLLAKRRLHLEQRRRHREAEEQGRERHRHVLLQRQRFIREPHELHEQATPLRLEGEYGRAGVAEPGPVRTAESEVEGDEQRWVLACMESVVASLGCASTV